MTTTLQDRIDATVTDGDMTWKCYGRDAEGKTHFVTFGTPSTYTRYNVRAIAERLFERNGSGATLSHIRRADTKRCPWVPAAKFFGNVKVSNNWGASK